MRYREIIVGLVLAFFSLSCDDITRAPLDPVASPPETPQTQVSTPTEQTPLEPKQSKLTKEDLIETYNQIIETRNGIMQWKNKLEPLRKSQDPYFSANRDAFRRWISERAMVIAIRQERISPEKNQLPNEHPGVSLDLAIRALKKMMGNYVEFYYLQKPIHPEYETELKSWLDDFEVKVKTGPFYQETSSEPEAKPQKKP